MSKIAKSIAALLIVGSLGACADMSRVDRDTALGAVGGAVVGSALGGGPIGTVGGAAVGGVIGHEVGKR